MPAKVRPPWLLVGHHELPAQYYTKNGTFAEIKTKPFAIEVFRMSTIHCSNVYDRSVYCLTLVVE